MMVVPSLFGHSLPATSHETRQPDGKRISRAGDEEYRAACIRLSSANPLRLVAAMFWYPLLVDGTEIAQESGLTYQGRFRTG